MAKAIPTIAPVPSPVVSDDWLAAAADAVGKVALDEAEEEDGSARLEVTVKTLGRVELELVVVDELVDRIV